MVKIDKEVPKCTVLFNPRGTFDEIVIVILINEDKFRNIKRFCFLLHTQGLHAQMVWMWGSSSISDINLGRNCRRFNFFASTFRSSEVNQKYTWPGLALPSFCTILQPRRYSFLWPEVITNHFSLLYFFRFSFSIPLSIASACSLSH